MTQRRPGVWLMRVSTGFDPKAGRYRARAATFRGTQAQAKRALARFVEQVEGMKTGDRSVTFAMLADEWMASAELASTTRRTYRSYLDRHILPALGRRRVSDLTPRDIVAFKAGLPDSLADATIRQMMAIVKRALGQAVEWELITSSPAALIRSRTPVVNTVIPTVDQVRRLIALVDASPSPGALGVRLAATTGARRGELCGLRWGDVSEDGSEIEIRRAVVWLKQPEVKSTKTKDGRRVLVDGDTARHLLARRAVCADLVGDPRHFYVLGPQPWEKIPLRPDSLSQAFKRFAAKCGVAGVRFHDLRHWHATWMVDHVDIRTLSDRLGHRRTSTTTDRYLKPRIERSRVGVDALGDELRTHE